MKDIARVDLVTYAASTRVLVLEDFKGVPRAVGRVEVLELPNNLVFLRRTRVDARSRYVSIYVLASNA